MNHFYHDAARKTPGEYKKEFVASLANENFTPEILRMALKTIEQEKPELFEPYQPLGSDEAICDDKHFWLKNQRYFYKQAHLCEKNFSQERFEHVITVKSYLIEQGIAGFPDNNRPQLTSERSDEMDAFDNIALDNNYTPPPVLKKYVDGGDLSLIRSALFMEMNDKQLTTDQIKQAFAWTLQQKPNLFVDYEENANAQAMNTNSAQWTPDYYGLQEVYANSNFSRERLSHMVEVREQVFNIAKKPKPEERSNVTQHQPDSPSPIGNNNRWIKYALIAGASIAALAILVILMVEPFGNQDKSQSGQSEASALNNQVTP